MICTQSTLCLLDGVAVWVSQHGRVAAEKCSRVAAENAPDSWVNFHTGLHVVVDAQAGPVRRAVRAFIGREQCINQIVAARLRHGSIMTSTPSTRRRLDGVAVPVPHRSMELARSLFAEKGLSEELSGAPDSRLVYAQAGKPLIDNGARPAADDDDDEGEEIAADLGELDIPGVGDY